jgi:hypothetical protein
MSGDPFCWNMTGSTLSRRRRRYPALALEMTRAGATAATGTEPGPPLARGPADTATGSWEINIQWLTPLMCRTCMRRSRSSCTPRQAGIGENWIEYKCLDINECMISIHILTYPDISYDIHSLICIKIHIYIIFISIKIISYPCQAPLLAS